MSDTLPNGWLGNDAKHHIVIGSVRIDVERPLDEWSPFAAAVGAKTPSRSRAYRYTVSIGGRQVATGCGINSAMKARDIAWANLRTYLMELGQEVDAVYAAATESHNKPIHHEGVDADHG